MFTHDTTVPATGASGDIFNLIWFLLLLDFFFFLVCFWGQILKGADGAKKGQINAEDSGLLCP